MQMLIGAASGITALTAIIAAVVKVYKVVKSIDDKVEAFSEGLKSNTLSTLRLVIINEDMPLQERINAGEEYVKMGGNGAIHAMYDKLVEKYKNEVN